MTLLKSFLVYLLHLFQPLPGLHRLELLRRPVDRDADKGVELVVALLAEEELTVVDHSDDLLIKRREKSHPSAVVQPDLGSVVL